MAISPVLQRCAVHSLRLGRMGRVRFIFQHTRMDTKYRTTSIGNPRVIPQ